METESNQLLIPKADESASATLSKADKRIHAMLLLQQGETVETAAQMLKLAPLTIRKWQREWRKLGADALIASLKQTIALREQECQQLREEMAEADAHRLQVQNRLDALQAESIYRSRQLEEAYEELALADLHVRIRLFQEMATTVSRPLRLLLALDEDSLLADEQQKWRWVLRLSSYLRTEAGLSLIGEEDAVFTLTQENNDAYEVEEQITLPCQVKVIRSGIAYKDNILQRPLVEIIQGK